MLPSQDLVTRLQNQFVALVVEALARVVRLRRSLLQNRVGSDHLARHQVRTDAEVFQRALRLSAPQFVIWHFNNAEAVGLLSCLCHRSSPFAWKCRGRYWPRWPGGSAAGGYPGYRSTRCDADTFRMWHAVGMDVHCDR